MSRRFFYFFAVILLLSIGSGYSAPARLGTMAVTQSDGESIEIQRHGDEYFHYTTTADGSLIALRDGIYYYADISSDGEITPSDVRPQRGGYSVTRNESGGRLATIASEAAERRRKQMAQSTPLTRSSSTPYVGATRATGDVRGLVLLVEFQDQKFTYTQSDFDRMINTENYSENEATGSVRDYYYDNSMGVFQPTFDIMGVYTLSQNMSFYGANDFSGYDMRPQEMVEEACDLANAAGVDFSLYDSDSDGFVDMVFVFYAGYNEAEGASEDTVWPHMWALSSPVPYDSKYVYIYACTSELKGSGESQRPNQDPDAEMAGIGTFAHEYGHTLGLADTYDTNGTTGGSSYGLYSFDIMSYGNYNNDGRTPPYYGAYQRYELGWIEPNSLVAIGEHELESIATNNAYIFNTEVEDEYYLFEYRNTTIQGMRCWDGYVSWDSYASINYGEVNGLFITHIDRSSNTAAEGYTAAELWEYNAPNAYLSHECARVVYSDPSTETLESTDDLLNMVFPGAIGKTSFGSNTSPAAKSWAGVDLQIDLSDIRVEDGVLKFSNYADDEDVIFDTDDTTAIYGDGYPTIEIVTKVEGDYTYIYHRIRNSDESDSVTCSLDGVTYDEGIAFLLSSGSYTLVYEITTADGERSKVTKYLEL